MFLDIVTKRNFTKDALLAPQSISNHTDVATKILDTRGARGAGVVIIVGTQTGDDVNNYMVPELQESDTVVGADFTAVAAEDVVGGVLPGSVTDNSISKIGYLGTKRYIRVNLNFTGTGISALGISVIGMLENNYLVPGEDPSPLTAQ